MAAHTVLANWVADKEKNGVVQHSDNWLAKKILTIGGSSLATIMGLNPFCTIPRMVGEKIGIYKFEGDIKPQWGNLFEDVIKRFVEKDRDCVILGENLYIEGPKNTAYSPDGLAVMIIDTDYTYEDTVITNGIEETFIKNEVIKKTAVVLIEFKCPFSRIPTGICPNYYIPQVKMGLDIIELTTDGMFIEGVFRKCTIDQLGPNRVYDKTLGQRLSGKNVLAYGVIGLYYDDTAYKAYINSIKGSHVSDDIKLFKMRESKRAKTKLWKAYCEYYIEFGDNTNEYLCNDIGESDSELFKIIMDAYDKKVLTPWFGSIVHLDNECDNGQSDVPDADIDQFTAFCASAGYLSFGVLPWKLFDITYIHVPKTPGYLAPYLPIIGEIIDVVRECIDPANEHIKKNIYNNYINRNNNGGFSDEM